MIIEKPLVKTGVALHVTEFRLYNETTYANNLRRAQFVVCKPLRGRLEYRSEEERCQF
jgi:hypothetical protein